MPGDRLGFAHRRDLLGARARPAGRRPDGVPVPGHRPRRHRPVGAPTRPTRSRVGGAFGDKSVLEMPGYRPPRWLASRGRPAGAASWTSRARALDADVPVTLWSPDGLRRPDARAAAARARRAGVRRAGRPHDVPRRAWSRPASCRRCGPRCSGPATATSGTPRTAPTPGPCAWRSCPGCGPRWPRRPWSGIGASLGALAMLHAQRQSARLLGRAVPAVRLVLPPAARRARAPVRPLRPGRAQRRPGAARAAPTRHRSPR